MGRPLRDTCRADTDPLGDGSYGCNRPRGHDDLHYDLMNEMWWGTDEERPAPADAEDVDYPPYIPDTRPPI